MISLLQRENNSIIKFFIFFIFYTFLDIYKGFSRLIFVDIVHKHVDII